VHVVWAGQSACVVHSVTSPGPHGVDSHATALPSVDRGYVHPGGSAGAVAFWRQHATAPVTPFAVQSETWLHAIGIAGVPPGLVEPFEHALPRGAHCSGANWPGESWPPRQHSSPPLHVRPGPQ
jgi:hypothetical protein